MRLIYADYNPYTNSIDVNTFENYILRIDCNKVEEVLLTFGFVHNQSEAFVRKLPVLMPALMKYRHMFYKNSPSSTSCTA